MKRVCVLLGNPIVNDSRVIKTIRTLQTYCKVDLYYVDGDKNDSLLFNENVTLHSYKYPMDLKRKLLLITFFYNEFNFLSSKVLSNGIRYDYVWANDLVTLKPAIRIKNTIGSKVIYDSHEIYIETLNQYFPDDVSEPRKIVNKVNLFFIQFIGSIVEDKLVKKADYIITVTESVKDFLSKKFKRDDIYVVMNCPTKIVENVKPINIKEEFNIEPDKFVLLYQGMLSEGRALTEMIKAQKYTNDNVRFIVMGDGGLKPKLVELAKSLSLEGKVLFKDKVPFELLLNYTKGADAGIILQEPRKNLSKRFGIANKFFEYMHAGIPFIATKAEENIRVANKFNVCIMIEENTPKLIAEAINTLSNQNLTQYKNNLFEASKVYNWENQEAIIKGIIKQ